MEFLHDSSFPFHCIVSSYRFLDGSFSNIIFFTHTTYGLIQFLRSTRFSSSKIFWSSRAPQFFSKFLYHLNKLMSKLFFYKTPSKCQLLVQEFLLLQLSKRQWIYFFHFLSFLLKLLSTLNQCIRYLITTFCVSQIKKVHLFLCGSNFPYPKL